MRYLNKSLEVFNLVIQPQSDRTKQVLYELGFQPLPQVLALFCRFVNNCQILDIFQKFQQKLSEVELDNTRCLITSGSYDLENILFDFLQSQPLNVIAQASRNAWFFPIVFQQNLFFHYQPIFDLNSGHMVAHECLVRSQDEEGNIFTGQQLIDAAIETNLIHEFDEIARNVCFQSLSQLGSQGTFFINVIPNTIVHLHHSFEETVKGIKRLGLQPEQIVFELTEVEVIGRSLELQQAIEKLREQGFLIAIDDLCGLAAINNYFLEFCPDIIKIDKQLIQGSSKNGLKQILLKSLLASAHEIGCSVVAEGLEQYEDIRLCRRLGVDLGQGFGLAMPDPILRKKPAEFMTKHLQLAC